jgi:hypothetical protein
MISLDEGEMMNGLKLLLLDNEEKGVREKENWRVTT